MCVLYRDHSVSVIPRVKKSYWPYFGVTSADDDVGSTDTQ